VTLDDARVVKGLYMVSNDGRLNREGESTINILAQRDEALSLPRQVCESIVCWIRLRFQSHVPPVAVKLPHEPRVSFECFGRRQLCCFVCPP